MKSPETTAPEPLPHRLLGIETEYGLYVEGRGAEDLMEESRLLVSAYQGPWAGPWDYRTEDPRRDMRGFRVDRLSYDEQDARYDRQGPPSRLSSSEQRADRVLANGARLYNDHGHPEYSTPECVSLVELVTHDRAGEWIVRDCARLRTERTGRPIRLYKNNTDFHGMSYGCHENYLCHRGLPFERLLQGLIPFLITRILFTGAGKAAVETGGPHAGASHYQLSQRPDFFAVEASVDTLASRPIFNTRDESHADPNRYRRLHVIAGDANMAEFATALKVGTTSLVLSLLEAGWEPLFRLEDPVSAAQEISRDPSLRWIVRLADGRTMRALDLQRLYLGEARAVLSDLSADAAWTLREWERVLDDLEADPVGPEDRVDWIAKRKLLESYIEAEGLWWENPALKSLDLAYHDLDPETGLFAALEQGGVMSRLTHDDQVERALTTPPAATRARLRGMLVRVAAERVRAISWGRAMVAVGKEGRHLSLRLDEEWGRNPEASMLPTDLPSLLERGTTEAERERVLMEWAQCPLPVNGELDDPDQG
jgi:Pup amidohydrolase